MVKMNSRSLPILVWLLRCQGLDLSAADGIPPAATNSAAFCPGANYGRLDDGDLTVAFDLTRGGAIAGIAFSGSARNLVNVADEGRYIQQSYYAGHRLARKAEGQAPNWSPWPWNPIQVGDAFGHRARLLTHTNDARLFYTKCIPMLWDMNNQPGEAEMEQWTSLSGRCIHVRSRLTCHRSADPYGEGVENSQEMPAVYPISALSQLYTYRGDKPFQNEPLENPAVVNLASGFWGTYDRVSEHWMAFVDDQNVGLAVYNPQCTNFLAGRSGNPGGETKDASTSYIAPVKGCVLMKNSVFEFNYDLVVGTLEQIRAEIYRLHQSQSPN
jgi:hypothetical protein